ncbi:MAG: hypothetical protein H3Z50_05990 [archaeon]|nr:hypothetical protein [archaeon]MCP8305505.1 hypothetical protein [archaeon]
MPSASISEYQSQYDVDLTRKLSFFEEGIKFSTEGFKGINFGLWLGSLQLRGSDWIWHNVCDLTKSAEG